MFRLTVLSSGSKGNSTVIATSRTRLLVDAGLSCREILKRMRQAGEDPEALDAILITHEHQDHVQGVGVLARKLGIPVYFTEMTHRAWMRWMTPRKRMTYADWLERRRAGQAPETADQVAAEQATPEQAGMTAALEDAPCGREDADGISLAAAAATPCEPGSAAVSTADPCESEDAGGCALPGLEYFEAGTPFCVGDIAVTPFTIPHDAADPVGFVFEAEGLRIGVATDLGYMPQNVKLALRGCDVLMIESNHDTEMLRDGPYPWSVKQRVMSRVGHLSNEATADFLERNYDGQAVYVVLAHLSESNNLPALARISAERALGERMNLLANKLILAEQCRPTEAICL